MPDRPVPDRLVKLTNQPEVWLVPDGQNVRRWIPDPETLQSQWNWGIVESFNGLDPAPESAFPDGTLIKGEYGAAIYVMEGGGRRSVADPDAFVAMGFRWEDVQVISDARLAAIPEGPPVGTWSCVRGRGARRRGLPSVACTARRS